jgi:hypothetical protein
VFFERLPIRWEYEVEGFHFDGKAYLPDFYLPDLRLWAEVKPIGGFTDEVIDLLNSFVRQSRHRVLLLEGAPVHNGMWMLDLAVNGPVIRVDAAFTEGYWRPDSENRLYTFTGVARPFPSQFPCDAEWDADVYAAIDAARSERFGT